MAAQEVDLQLTEDVAGDGCLRECAKSGVDAVDGLIALGAAIDDDARTLDRLQRAGGDRDEFVAIGDRHELLERERGTVDLNHASTRGCVASARDGVASAFRRKHLLYSHATISLCG